MQFSVVCSVPAVAHAAVFAFPLRMHLVEHASYGTFKINTFSKKIESGVLKKNVPLAQRDEIASVQHKPTPLPRFNVDTG